MPEAGVLYWPFRQMLGSVYPRNAGRIDPVPEWLHTAACAAREVPAGEHRYQVNTVGFKTLLSKEGRRERALAKAIAKAGNTKIKSDDRRPALYQLMDDGCPEAIGGLLRRFTFNYDTNMVADEEEKNAVYQALVAMGPKVLPEVRKHLRSSPTLSWALRLLGQVATLDERWQAIAEVMRDYEPGYQRDPSRKQQLLTFLGDLDDERVSETIVAFLEDHDENVRFITMEALFKRGNDEVAREPLLKLLIDEEEESLRLKNRVAEGFVEQGWVVKGYRGSVEKALSEDFVVDGKGRIRRKKGRG